MENPNTWTKAQRVIAEALRKAGQPNSGLSEQPKRKYINAYGYSVPTQIYLALKAEGLLKKEQR